MTIGELLAQGKDKLKPCSATPGLDAEVFLAAILRTDRAALIRDRDEELRQDVMIEFRALLERRERHEPVHYILGQREFWSITFKVRRGVLIPRPETELVVETSLHILKALAGSGAGAPIRVADLGTGCGNIAVALALELPDCVIDAVDISEEALECARENVDDNGVAHRVRLHRGDFFEPLSVEGHKFDVIVSNPPYVSSEEMKELPPEVKDYEPHLALHGGKEGLHYLRQIIDLSPQYLKTGGAVVLELGMQQGKPVLQLMEKRGRYSRCEIIKDYAGLDRVALAYTE
jgi:release factor glutamine methyltransferase